MTEPMSVLHLTGKDPSSGQIKTFDFEIVDEVARRQKADKADTVQETTLSRGRKEGTEVGEGSVAFGTDVEASGEGSHAEGNGTIANAPYMYAFGEYNAPAEALPEWVAETEYAAGDKVIYDGKAYVCDTANSDAEFDPTKWTETEMPEAPVFVIGNGTSENSRGDAFAVERDGDVKAGGDLYTNYDPATGTGKKVATEDYVGDLIGDVVSVEYAVADELPATGEVGTIYLIPNGETSGTDTHDEYIWVPATESFEKIGNTKVDLSDYALKTDTVLNTTLSMGRKAGTTVGSNSVALGNDVTASNGLSFAEGSVTTASGLASHAEGIRTTANGTGAHAEGKDTTASKEYAHAEGFGTTASGDVSHAEGKDTTASGTYSHAEGSGTQATGLDSHAEGDNTTASGYGSHAEGIGTIADVTAMHAQGFYNKQTEFYPAWESGRSYKKGDKVQNNTIGYECIVEGATNQNSDGWKRLVANSDTAFVIGNGTYENHSNAFEVKWDGSVEEGYRTKASGSNSHAEGSNTKASGPISHAEGVGTEASGPISHAEGSNTKASGPVSHAEGAGTEASGVDSHAEGSNTKASGPVSHAEGVGTNASGEASHAEGFSAKAESKGAHAEGESTKATFYNAHAEGYASTASGYASHAEGSNTGASNTNSHAEGMGTTASGVQAHAEGSDTKATNSNSHAEGEGTQASGVRSHAEGGNTTASGDQSHAEGGGTTASGTNAHAEGVSTQAAGAQSHTEGDHTQATGDQSHAEGGSTAATGQNSHAEGSRTIANGVAMHAQGKYNKPDDTVWPDWEASKSYAVGDKVTYGSNGYTCKTANSDAKFTSSKWTKELINGGEIAFVIGNGTADNARSNALTVNWDGTQKIAGDLYTNYNFNTNTGNKVATEAYVTEAIAGAGGGGSDEYALKTDTVLNTTLSMGRKAETTVGENSTALGANVEASGSQSHAEGSRTTASGVQSHAEGVGSQATGTQSHAEGQGTRATGNGAHAEGGGATASGDQSHAEGATTQATGLHSHAEGGYTVANGASMHAQGIYNKLDDTVWADWVASKSYAAGDKVTYRGHGYICKTANSDATFTYGKWNDNTINGDVAFVIGNGTSNSNRSNAFAVKWDGTTTAAGDVYANNTKKLATEEYVNNAVAGAGGGSDEYALKTDTVLNTTLSMGRKAETTVGQNSTALGLNVTASGPQSHAEGGGTAASGPQSHAEGGATIASGTQAHAEGNYTTASGNQSHAEGSGTTASNLDSHAEGGGTTASGQNSHAEGGGTQATGDQSHAEGSSTTATAHNSHAEGSGTIANGVAMHAQGIYNKTDDTVWADWVSGKSYAVDDKVTYQGNGYTCNTANSDATFTSSKWTRESSNGDVAFVIGNGTADNARSNAFLVKWDGSVQEGNHTTASGAASHAEGGGSQATGAQSHAEGGGTQASGHNSHAEGSGSQASGWQSHAEGSGSQATGNSSHAEGGSAIASGDSSHAEGGGSQATGNTSHAEGYRTIANGTYMHAQGKCNKPDDTVWPNWVASKSYAVGDKVTCNGVGYTCKTANSDAEFTASKWTKEYRNGDVAFVIGNGTGDNARSNAFSVNWDGTTTAAGDIYANNTKKVATEEYVNNAVAGAGGGADLTSIENRLAVLEGDEDTAGSVAEAKAVANQALEEAQSCVYVDQGTANSGHHLWVDGNGNVTAELPTQIMVMDSTRTDTFVITFSSNGGLTVSKRNSDGYGIQELYSYKNADDELAARIKTLEDKVAALEGT